MTARQKSQRWSFRLMIPVYGKFSIRHRSSIVRCVESYPFQITRTPNSIRSRPDDGQLMIWQSVSSWKLYLSLWAITLRVHGEIQCFAIDSHVQFISKCSLNDHLCPFTDNWQLHSFWWWQTNRWILRHTFKKITSYLAWHNCCAPLGDHVLSFFEVRHDFCWRNPCLLRTTFIIKYWSPLPSSSTNKRPVMYEKCRYVMDSVSLLAFIGKISIHVFGWFRHEYYDMH